MKALKKIGVNCVKGVIKMLIGDLLIEKENNRCFIYVNGKKLDIEQANLLQLLNSNIDREFSKEITGLLDKLPDTIIRQSVKLETKFDLFINAINEHNKTVYGIKAGETNRTQAFNILKKILKKEKQFDQISQYVSFPEIGIALYFNVENNIVEEIILTSPFEGSTTLGLKIGYTIERACQLCGEPKIRTITTAFWNNFSVYIKNEIITTIRISL
jgi:hypothetical protein